MENPQVFAATHRLIRAVLGEGSVTGLRIDHPDGLYNPRQYFTRLQMLYGASQCSGPEPRPPLAENGIELEFQEIFGQQDWLGNRPPLYLLVEKVLEPGEELPCEWTVDGTVGYDFLNLVNGVFIERRNERAFTNLYHRFVGESTSVDEIIYNSKKLIMETALPSEVNVLTHMLEEISSTERRARDFTRNSLRDAIQEIIACFPVYRTYIDERGNVSERDRQYIAEATARAKRGNQGTPAAIFDFVRDTLLLKDDQTIVTPDSRQRRLQFTLKFQQLTGPVMAKGLEDTTCYVFNRFVSVNEVGGTPKKFGLSLDEFHSGNLKRAEQWPFSMLATSTHDTKRSEDVRARLDVLSEMPKQWAEAVRRWRRANRAKKRILSDGRSVPDGNEEYLLYQTLVGAAPWLGELKKEPKRADFVARIQQYMNKAVHEAKRNLSWVNSNPEYIDALEQFVARILAPSGTRALNPFWEDFVDFYPSVTYFGIFNSLAQTVLKITAPGVPDIYQGNELWDFSLVDPDNRRAVNFQAREKALAELAKGENNGDLVSLCRELLRKYQNGRIKMWTTMRTLTLRREQPAVFQAGAYIPLQAQGSKANHVVAFARTHGDEAVITVVPRLSYTLAQGREHPPTGDVWAETELVLPRGFPGLFFNIFNGQVCAVSASRTLSCREIFSTFPVALLTGR
jgi:(1->4)-alpha-D-glucan 1-alpha-D-glucosylmutase